MTEAYQQRIRNSPLWDQMVRDFGEQKATEILKEFKVQIDDMPSSAANWHRPLVSPRVGRRILW